MQQSHNQEYQTMRDMASTTACWADNAIAEEFVTYRSSRRSRR